MAVESGVARSKEEIAPYDREAPELEPGMRPLPPAGGAAAGGAAAGVFAGTLMMLVLMIWSASMGQGFWTPLQLVGASLTGVKAVLGGFWPGLLGLALHLATAAAWGTMFAALVSPESRAYHAFWAGLLYGVCVWGLMTWVGLPILDRTLGARLGLMEGPWFVSHLVYGAALACAPALRRRMGEGDAVPVEDGELFGPSIV